MIDSKHPISLSIGYPKYTKKKANEISTHPPSSMFTRENLLGEDLRSNIFGSAHAMLGSASIDVISFGVGSADGELLCRCHAQSRGAAGRWALSIRGGHGTMFTAVMRVRFQIYHGVFGSQKNLTNEFDRGSARQVVRVRCSLAFENRF